MSSKTNPVVVHNYNYIAYCWLVHVYVHVHWHVTAPRPPPSFYPFMSRSQNIRESQQMSIQRNVDLHDLDRFGPRHSPANRRKAEPPLPPNKKKQDEPPVRLLQGLRGKGGRLKREEDKERSRRRNEVKMMGKEWKECEWERERERERSYLYSQRVDCVVMLDTVYMYVYCVIVGRLQICRYCNQFLSTNQQESTDCSVIFNLHCTVCVHKL